MMWWKWSPRGRTPWHLEYESGSETVIARETRISELFVVLADTLIDDFDVVDFLHVLADACIELLDVEAAGLMLANPRGGLRLVASAPDLMRDLELFELQADEGPCLDTFSTGEPVVNVDLKEAKERWPKFTAAALAAACARPTRCRSGCEVS